MPRRRRRNGARVIKAAQVSGPGDVRDLERFHVDFHLLDARSRTPGKRELRGGTGETFDWTLLAERRSKVPLILSGGLTAENVAEAIALARPYAVDTASGTEAAPGRKDPEQAAALCSTPCSGERRIDRRFRARPPQAGGRRERTHRTSPVVEHRFGPYGGQFVPETLMPALAGARAGVVRCARGRRLSG